MRAGLMQSGDDVSEGLARARYFAETAFLDHLVQWHRQHTEAFGGPSIGAGAVGIAATQRNSLPKLAQQLYQLGCLDHGHCQQQTREALDGSGTSALARARNPATKVYHFSGSRFYGQTRTGKYMCRSESEQAGFRAAKNERAPESR
jgi:hypothetical protein